jgi:hypothetical protein
VRAWELFLKSQTTTRDILLKGYTDKDKSSLICLFLRHRHLKGLPPRPSRESDCIFSSSLQPTGFLDAAAITTARQACLLTPEELRVKRDAGASTSVKLPACEGMLVSTRTRLWEGQEWTGHGLVNRMTYLACMFGFDQSGRVSEYTAAEPKHQGVCVTSVLHRETPVALGDGGFQVQLCYIRLDSDDPNRALCDTVLVLIARSSRFNVIAEGRGSLFECFRAVVVLRVESKEPVGVLVTLLPGRVEGKENRRLRNKFL